MSVLNTVQPTFSHWRQRPTNNLQLTAVLGFLQPANAKQALICYRSEVSCHLWATMKQAALFPPHKFSTHFCTRLYGSTSSLLLITKKMHEHTHACTDISHTRKHAGTHAQTIWRSFLQEKWSSRTTVFPGVNSLFFSVWLAMWIFIHLNPQQNSWQV